jgi:hypothetical protein
VRSVPAGRRLDERSGALELFTSNLTKSTPFTYLPPNSHLTTSASLGLGTSTSYVVTQDGSSNLPRLYVDIPVNVRPTSSTDGYELIDEVALRNGVRACATGTVSC